MEWLTPDFLTRYSLFCSFASMQLQLFDLGYYVYPGKTGHQAKVVRNWATGKVGHYVDIRQRRLEIGHQVKMVRNWATGKSGHNLDTSQIWSEFGPGKVVKN